MLYNKVIKIFLILILAAFFAPKAFCAVTPIDAQRSAQSHNNKGVDYLREGDFIAAIKEFKIAIGINPKSQTTAVYYNNLGRAYLSLAKLNSKGPFAAWAQMSFENAIAQDCMNFSFYENLVESFAISGNLKERLAYYGKDSAQNPFSGIVVGLIYLKTGQKAAAKATLGEFAKLFPDLVITGDVKKKVATIK